MPNNKHVCRYLGLWEWFVMCVMSLSLPLHFLLMVVVVSKERKVVNIEDNGTQTPTQDHMPMAPSQEMPESLASPF